MGKTLKRGEVGNNFVNWKVAGKKVDSSLKCHTSNYQLCDSRKVDYVVLHFTGNKSDTAKANANYFSKNSGLNASAHFFVDENSCYQSVSLCDKAWAVGDGHGAYGITNSNSISIEMCTSGNYKVSATTQKNAAYLTAKLCKLLNISYKDVPKYVVRHYDASRKKCPAQMCGSTANNLKWKAFLRKVKAEYKKLK